MAYTWGSPSVDPDNLDVVRGDDDLIEHLRAGGSGDDELARDLAAMRDNAQRDAQ